MERIVLASALILAFAQSAGAAEVWPGLGSPSTCTLLDTAWITYADWNSPFWISSEGPEHATKFDPTAFGLTYPFSITKVKAEFFLHPQLPWDDSSFRFRVYGGDGETLLYQSPVLEAVPGQPGPPIVHQLNPPVQISSGQFYLSVAPVSSSGRPTSVADSSSDGRSYTGSAGNWSPFTLGEFFNAVLTFQYYCRLVGPNGGQYWAGGDTHMVTWSVNPKDFFYGKLLLSTNGGSSFPDVIAQDISPSDTTFTWAVPTKNSASCRVKFQAYDSTDFLVCQDASDANFTIDSQDPAAPVLIYPPNSGAINLQSVVFRWHRASDNLSGIDYHTIQIAYDSLFTALVDTARRSDTTYARLLPGDTSYYWRVRGTDRCGNVGPWSQKWKFEIDLQTPESPTLLEPADGQWFRTSTVQFRWTPVQFTSAMLSAVRYVIELDTILGIRPLYTDTTVAVYDTFSFLPEHRYWWRVRAYDLAGNQGPFSATRRFGIDMTAPLIPGLIYPPHLSGVQSDTVSLIWHKAADAVSGTELHHAQLASDSSFADTIALPGGPILQDTTVVATLPGMAGYYWRVRAQDTAGNWCNWSLVRKFTYSVGIAEQPAGTPDVPSLRCMPNPSKGRTAITVALPSATNASVAVYDAAGVKVAAMWRGLIPAGRHTFVWDSRTITGRAVGPGVYLVRVTGAKLPLVASVRVVR